jgi:endoglucanase Acf2
VSPAEFEPSPFALDKSSDWSIDIAMGQSDKRMLATVSHGSPYVYFQFTQGDAKLHLPKDAQSAISQSDARILTVSSGGVAYAAFAPSGGRWEKQADSDNWKAHLPAGRGYLSVAALSDTSAASLALLAKHAYAFIQNTYVDWHYDQAKSVVETQFRIDSKNMEGTDFGPLIGLYPHHWFNNSAVEGKLGPSYDTVRGKIKLLEAGQFSTQAVYHGFLPYWPKVNDAPHVAELNDLMKTDMRNARRMMLEVGNGPYWQGKGLQRITQLMNVVEQQGDIVARDQLLALLKTRVESWFTGDSNKTYFHYAKSLGTVVAHPEEYFSVEQMNDHHFHYGYWIHAMADIALRDPQWAAKDKWGGMVDVLIKDIATAKRGQADFPFLRNFDPYEGHSWAGGIGMGPYGNNQESSSEAINAWAGLILWAEITGNKELRDLGLYLYTTEISAVNHYWFDIHHIVFAPEYQNAEVSMLFGSKYAHNTWWVDEPREIKGINLLPITAASTYLADDPAFVKRSLATLKPEMEIHAKRGGKRPDPVDIWQDIFAQYMALADPAQGLAQWDRWGSFELGDTRSHALHLILSLQQMGTPDSTVTADTALYGVFKKAKGSKTYLAFNASSVPVIVHFSDGKTMDVAARSLAQTQ